MIRDHRQDALSFIERAHRSGDATWALAEATIANAYATLALAEEQRTANLAVYMESTLAAEQRSGTRLPQKAADWLMGIAADIRERIGLER